jgi:hypothetical protein
MATRRPNYSGWGADSDTGSEGGASACSCEPTRILPCPHVEEPTAAPAPNGMAVGAKGSAVYTAGGVGDPRVVLSVKAVRGAAAADLVAVHDDILAAKTDEMLLDAVLLAFQNRDIRGGKGERAIFHTLFQNIAKHYPVLAENLVDLVPEYGSWRDIFTLAAQAPALQSTIFKLVTDQLRRDEFAACAPVENPAGVSLLAKWAPREGNAQDRLAKSLAAHIWVKDPDFRVGTGANASYRKRLAALNAFLKTTETYECSNRWDEIEPKRVPARARELKMASYLNEKVQTKDEKKDHEPKVLRHPDDAKRMACREHFQEFFKKAAKGEVKISGAQTLYPHELVQKVYRGGTEDEMNAWNAVWDQMVAKASASGGLGSSVAMCDFSGSMQCAAGAGDTPYWVSMAMGLLIASVNSGPFKNRFMTFDSTPTWHSLFEGSTLEAAVAGLKAHPGIGQGTSTDFQKAMDLLLQTLKDTRTPPGQEPKNLIVITDMGWDQACNKGGYGAYTGNSYRNHYRNHEWETHLESIKASFKREGGWEPPRIVIWNVAATYSNDFQAQANTPGVLMLSGWSPSLFKILCEEGPRCVTPYDALRAQLDDKRYDPVRTRVSEWLKGGWRGVA